MRAAGAAMGRDKSGGWIVGRDYFLEFLLLIFLPF
jgi:hypothetical protein